MLFWIFHDFQFPATNLWQVARLLSDSSVPQFYPTLFVLVTDVLDTVGNLVWNRIKKKAECDDDGNAVAVLPGIFWTSFTLEEADLSAIWKCHIPYSIF